LQGLLWFQKCWRQKNCQVSNSVASSKKLEPENLDAITCSCKIVLCQECKLYHSWHQLWSHDTVVLLLVTCQKGKLLCLLWSFLLYWTFVYFGAIFMLKMKQKLSLRTTTASLPTACKHWHVFL
jgi:hypothetical protein